MATLLKEEAGRFRANPDANVKNNCCFIDEDTPGTPLEDTGTIDTTAATAFEGITYTGKDGNSNYIPFQKTLAPDAQKVEYTVLVSAGRDALLDALRLAIAQHECDPIITVKGSGANYDVLHIGSGTLESVRLDGTDEVLSRGAISALSGEGQVAASGAKSKAKKKAWLQKMAK